ncbi:MAG: ribonuclease HI [Eubacteriales bacterium]|nr:ribonuclease HI [Eubacteriales bacterium]
MKKIDLYTDGACSGNPGVGGWACVLIYNGIRKTISGGEKETTNNRMELMAVIRGLETLKQECMVDIYSDSAYVVNAIEKGWIDNWQKNGWKTAKKDDVLNKDLWQKLLELTKKHPSTFIKVKGHADNELNNLCDKMAVEEVNKIKQSV